MSVATKDYSDDSPYSNGYAPAKDKDVEKFDVEKLDEDELDEKAVRRRASIAEGQVKHNKLGWKRLTVCHSLDDSLEPPGHQGGRAQSNC